MTTEMISLSEYRKNLSALYQKSQDEQIIYIVTVHGKPVWNITPIKKEDIHVTTKYSQDFIDELAEMERDYEAGNYVELNTREDVDAYFAKLL